jgi:hypothetical protein
VATQRAISVGVFFDLDDGARVLDGRREREARRTDVCTSLGDAGTAADEAGSLPPTVSSGAAAFGGGEEELAGAAELGLAWRRSLSDGGSAASALAAAACSLSVCTITTLWKPSAAVGCSCFPLSMRRTTVSADLPSTPPAHHHALNSSPSCDGLGAAVRRSPALPSSREAPGVLVRRPERRLICSWHAKPCAGFVCSPSWSTRETARSTHSSTGRCNRTAHTRSWLRCASRTKSCRAELRGAQRHPAGPVQ